MDTHMKMVLICLVSGVATLFFGACAAIYTIDKFKMNTTYDVSLRNVQISFFRDFCNAFEKAHMSKPIFCPERGDIADDLSGEEGLSADLVRWNNITNVDIEPIINQNRRNPLLSDIIERYLAGKEQIETRKQRLDTLSRRHTIAFVFVLAIFVASVTFLVKTRNPRPWETDPDAW